MKENIYKYKKWKWEKRKWKNMKWKVIQISNASKDDENKNRQRTDRHTYTYPSGTNRKNMGNGREEIKRMNKYENREKIKIKPLDTVNYINESVLHEKRLQEYSGNHYSKL